MNLKFSEVLIYRLEKCVQSEVLIQYKLLDDVADDVKNSREKLREKSVAIKDTRPIGDNVCWMYLVIAGEVLFMIMIIYKGLS